jgi:hypothetical protein
LEPGVYEVHVTVSNASGAFVGSDTTGSELTILGEAHFSGDVDANLVVNERDLYEVWQEQLKPASERDPAMDLNGDGSVDDADLNTVKGHYLQTFGPAPSSWGTESGPAFRQTWIGLESTSGAIDRSVETLDRQQTGEKSGLLFRGQSLKGLTEGSPEVRETYYWQRWRTEA